MIISSARISKTWTSKFKNLNKLTLKNWVKIIKKYMNKIEVFPQIGIINIDIHRIRIIVWTKEILLFQNLTEVAHKINKLILRMNSVNLVGVMVNELVIPTGHLALMWLLLSRTNVVIWKIKLPYGKQEIVMLKMILFAKYQRVTQKICIW